MKKSITIVLLLIIAVIVKAEVSKTINITTAGSLSTLLTSNEKITVTNLKVIGSIDASDIKCIRDEITHLADLDLSLANIQAYTGKNGTFDYDSYSLNELPACSFWNSSKSEAKTSLQNIILPNSLTSIGDHAFVSCLGLKTIPFPSTLTQISAFAFLGCDSLTDIILPKNLKIIAFSAFYGCGSINKLYLPDSLLRIDMFAFSNCKSINELVLPIGLSSLGTNAFENCSSITGNIIIPEGITSIEANSFKNCQLINSVTLPSNLSSIGNMAFKDCSSLKTIYCNNPIPPNLNIGNEVSNDCFTGATSVTDVYVQNASVYKANADWSSYFPGNIIKNNEITGNLNYTINQIKVYASSQGINIEGLIQGENVKIFDVKGLKIHEDTSDGEKLIFSVKRNALYFVIIGTKKYKVMV